MTISAAQCRAARALLNWTQDQLAQNAQVARATIADFERNTRMGMMRQNLISITSAFVAAGVAFIPEDGNGAGTGSGVRFRKVELEHSTTLKPDGDGFILPVRYRGKPYSVVIERKLIDDIGDLNYHNGFHTPAERLAVVQNHLPKFLCAAEDKFMRGGQIAEGDRVTLSHGDFPDGAFGSLPLARAVRATDEASSPRRRRATSRKTPP
jgi:DNA-binding XRE family transcriptional regulator